MCFLRSFFFFFHAVSSVVFPLCTFVLRRLVFVFDDGMDSSADWASFILSAFVGTDTHGRYERGLNVYVLLADVLRAWTRVGSGTMTSVADEDLDDLDADQLLGVS
jgi:hypothetical protein